MNENKVQTIVEKVKELVQRGNVSRIVVRKGERVLLDIPVNVGIVGGVVAVTSAKWLLLASILATVGFGCRSAYRFSRSTAFRTLSIRTARRSASAGERIRSSCISRFFPG